MARIRCFLLVPTGRVSVALRRYVRATGSCPLHGYHDARVRIEDEPEEHGDAEHPDYITNGSEPALDQSDPRWPARCECGYVFQPEDEWQRFTERIYVRQGTGEEMTLRGAPAGAMWEAPWLDELFAPQGDHNLIVMTPGGEWTVDGPASNCTMKEDFGQRTHHCWVRSGAPPDVTVGKNGPTCSAGAGSIQCRDYHGFLRNGYLED